MKNVRVRVREACGVNWWDYGIYIGTIRLMDNLEHKSGTDYWRVWWQKSAAIRNAKSMAERIGIPYDPEIIKQHGC